MVADKVDYTGMILLHRDLFKFDESRQYLIEMANQDNRQNIGHLFDGGSYTSALYDVGLKRIVDPKDVNNDALRQFEELKIPNKILYNISDLSESDINNYNTRSIINQQGFYSVTKALSNRLNGVLPTIKIDGTEFILDIKSLSLTKANEPEKKFLFKPRDLLRAFIAFYNTRTKSPVNIDSINPVSPQDLVLIGFRSLSEMDIVGLAEYHGLPGTQWVTTSRCKFEPQQMEIIKVSTSLMVELIKNRKSELGKQQKMNGTVDKVDKLKRNTRRRKL